MYPGLTGEPIKLVEGDRKKKGYRLRGLRRTPLWTAWRGKQVPETGRRMEASTVNQEVQVKDPPCQREEEESN